IDGEGGLFVAVSDPEMYAGIWRYDANRLGQIFSPAEPFVAGVRDTDAIAVEHGIATDAIGLGVYVTEHRQLQNPVHPEQESAFPAARLLKVSRAEQRKPLSVFPGQWAPSDLLIYDRRRFPPQYRGGVFIAFRASQPNGAPFPEGSG